MSTPANATTPRFDPGLTQQYTGALLRAINKDGSFNVRRRGLHGLAGNIYTLLVHISWPRFLGMLACTFLLVNMLFASVYLALGPGAIHASQAEIGLGTFGGAFFFSAQTLTTVGYGFHLSGWPQRRAVISSFEVTMGLLGFALATGLVFTAHVSHGPPRSSCSTMKMVVAPFNEGTSLQFRIANQRSAVIAEVEARMLLMTVEQDAQGKLNRNFVELSLERKSVLFLALTWNIVHPIDETSPLWGKSREDLERTQAELLILIKGYDDSFSQVVHTRYSYRWDEIEWSASLCPGLWCVAGRTHGAGRGQDRRDRPRMNGTSRYVGRVASTRGRLPIGRTLESRHRSDSHAHFCTRAWWGGPPGPQPAPWPASAGRGVPRGPGGPPHQARVHRQQVGNPPHITWVDPGP